MNGQCKFDIPAGELSARAEEAQKEAWYERILQ